MQLDRDNRIIKRKLSKKKQLDILPKNILLSAERKMPKTEL